MYVMQPRLSKTMRLGVFEQFFCQGCAFFFWGGSQFFWAHKSVVCSLPFQVLTSKLSPNWAKR